jgi:S1-C subfamily serine protease
MANEAQQFSDALAGAVEKAARFIVTVDARHHVPASGLVWSADSEVLTADHIVQRDDKISVTLPDGQTVSATVVGRDPGSDLALLKVEASGLAVPDFAEVKVGHLVLAVGRPDDVQASLGNVVAVGGPVHRRRRHFDAYIQSDVTMYPGFSGGPLVDASGRVVGLNSSALARGASLAIPVPEARAITDSLRQDGRVKRGYLGVGTQPVALAEGVAAQLGQTTGLMLIGVEKDSPAEKGGLLQGDVLVSLGEHAVTDIDDLQAALGPASVGQKVAIKVVRGGEVKELSVSVGVRE